MKKQVNNINWTVGVQSHAEIMCDMNKKKYKKITRRNRRGFTKGGGGGSETG